ncbi:hypothetical protein CCY99_06050 [Helicobacter sp. 16-1353]|uniref:M20/M25/M40 family metallo-hydrolase n=1 Tax=Helicobacter sp. 16-1353 TaxID=2004996 RepID=UPI000DCDC88E|nr:M20/M25/M40 family metallo-hydrolase [Helicobacter sp. 16-1353]RAX53152.1 hypothetical protein CCY99_06050 [Helicobacter sp. 16-1353]
MKDKINALDLFYKICEIPHPSSNTEKLKDFIISFALRQKCEVKSDSFGNIHLLKGKPKICLQAHYDMVLIGEKVEPIIKGDFITSKDSSLGADNGAALSAILYFSQLLDNFEAIITNDEEIGMIGANNLALKIQSKQILNLDSEDINQIVVGCAGGFDADIKLKPKFKKCKMKYFYELRCHNFSGGHSGIDINKNIPNAIVELVWAIYNIPCEIVSISGGEKRNSIPANARAIIATKKPLKYANDNSIKPTIKITKINKNYKKSFNKKVLKAIYSIHSGVYEMCDNSVISSLNISLINNKNIKMMIRANRKNLLFRQMESLKMRFKNIKISGLYDAWEREDSILLKNIEQVYRNQKIDYEIVEIHAGLECGILRAKCDEIVSIGPTISNPHSKAESMDLKSFNQFLEILEILISS